MMPNRTSWRNCERSCPQDVTVADVRAVLAEMDPPECYVQQASAEREDVQGMASASGNPQPTVLPAKPRACREALIGAFLSVLPLILLPMFIYGSAHEVTTVTTRPPTTQTFRQGGTEVTMITPVRQARPASQIVGLFGLLLLSGAGLLATPLGLWAISKIRRSAGRLYGMGLAVYDTLLYPLLILDGLSIWAGYALNGCFFSGKRYLALFIVVSAAVGLIMDVFIAVLTWKAANKPAARAA